MGSAEEIRVRRNQLKEQYGNLYDQVLEVLQRHDPMGIGLIPDEYDLVVETVLPRLKEARTAGELRQIIYEEFIDWFSPVGATKEKKRTNHSAGAEERYEGIAQDVWALIHGGAN